MTKKQMYCCDTCSESFESEWKALECELRHAREMLANALLKEKYSLSLIAHLCGFRWNLSEENKDATADNCYVFSHWQCCEKPAYRIVRIDRYGGIELRGAGSWAGHYGNVIDASKLPNPHPQDELYIHKDYDFR